MKKNLFLLILFSMFFMQTAQISYAWTAFTGAAEKGDIATVRKLLNNGIDVNTVDIHGGSALCYASARGYPEIVRLLIRHGADVNLADDIGTTAITNASWYGHVDIVKVLLENNADIHATNKYGHAPIGRTLYRLERENVSPGLANRLRTIIRMLRNYDQNRY